MQHPRALDKGLQMVPKELDPEILGYMLHRKSQLRETLSFLARKPGMIAAGWVTLQQLTRLPSLPI